MSSFDWSEPLVPGEVVLDDRVAPNASWSAVVEAGHLLTIVDVGGNQSGDCLIYRAADTEERYSVPDTLAWQGNAYVRTGTVLRSNLGNPLMTVVGNEIEKNARRDGGGVRVTVQLEQGGSRRFDFRDSGGLRVGDRVRIEGGQLYRL